MRKLFGTDGIRGEANIYPITGEIAMALGRVVTHYFQLKSTPHAKPLIVVGKDTRRSCYMLEQAFSAGVCSQGGRVILTGPLPTPAVAFVTQSMRANAGVMISASHNPFYDNGIKIFDSEGHKLSDDIELELEKMVFNQKLVPTKTKGELGNARRLDEVVGRYIVQVKSAFNKNYTLEGLRIVLDCANGAAYKVAPMIFSELGADMISLGVSPNGENINDESGALYPQRVREEVKKYQADLGICLDGDADRVVMIDKNSEIVKGDQLIGILTRLLLDQGKLRPKDRVIGTSMSNLGLEHYIQSLGLEFERTRVGDRYIMERMKQTSSLLGGEPSGHFIYRDHSTTGDGCLAALKIIEAMKWRKKNLQELAEEIVLFPQVLKNTMVKKRLPLESIDSLQRAVKKVENQLGQKGRVLLRYSGTEPLVRVMVEGEQQDEVEGYCNELTQVISCELDGQA